MKTFGTKPLRIYLKWLNLSKKNSDVKAIIKELKCPQTAKSYRQQWLNLKFGNFWKEI